MMTFWIVILIGMLAFELVTLGNLVSVWFAFGALGAIIATYFTENIVIQSFVFAILSAASLFLIRPLVKTALQGQMIPTNSDRLIGKTFRLHTAITDDAWGTIMVEGSSWSAIGLEHEHMDAGTWVEILAIEGVKLIVKQIGGNN